VALFAQAVGQAAIPRMSQLAASAHYVHLRLLLWRVIGVSALLSVPSAIALYVLGKPAIYLLFQHGAFTNHSTDLTTLALLGYAVGLPGSIAGELLVRGFYSLKDAYTPLFIDILALAGRFGFILLFLDLMAGPSAILAIPLATSAIATTQALLLCILLMLRLQKREKTDKGMKRLKQMRIMKLKVQTLACDWFDVHPMGKEQRDPSKAHMCQPNAANTIVHTNDTLLQQTQILLANPLLKGIDKSDGVW